ncbi:MAG: Crp/Fnr family transcriptional regulator [Vicinamibacterales bacterium]
MQAIATRRAFEDFEAATGLRLPHLDAVLAAVRVSRLVPRAAAFHAGEARARVYLVRAGLLKQAYVDVEGGEWIKSFAGPGDLFACLDALGGGVTSFASVAIEPSVVEWIEWRVIERAAAGDVAWQRAVRMAFQALAHRKVHRERDLLMLTPEQLYWALVRDTPGIAARVPQRDLAAYSA